MKRSFAYWFMMAFMIFSTIMLFTGQTMALFNYEWTVSLKLQEPVSSVGEHIKEFNRAMGLADTLVYIVLVLFSVYGLVRRRRWALITSAGVFGISMYWTSLTLCLFTMLKGKPPFTFEMPVAYWVILGSYFLVGLWGTVYLCMRGERLIEPA
jgi:hypothetical protein